MILSIKGKDYYLEKTIENDFDFEFALELLNKLEHKIIERSYNKA